MAMLREKIHDMKDLLTLQVRDLYDAEHRLTEAIPKMADAASEAELKKAFQHHLQETKNHVTRLEQVFQELDQKPERETCEGIKGVIAEGEQMVKAKAADSLHDAALIAAAQRVEHYEMAGYGSARTFAQHLGLDKVASLLQETLDEEGNADKTLTEIAGKTVNRKAAASKK